MPFAPGTFGALAAIPFIFLFKDAHFLTKLVFFICLLIIAIWVSNEAEFIFSVNDPKQVVIDEVVGMLMAALFLHFKWKLIIISFFVFRIFDISKPFFVKKVEKLKGGVGIVMDDIIAGAITYLLMFVFLIVSG